MSAGFNLADAFDVVAETCAARDAVVQGGQSRSWAELERRARNLAAWMIERGASRQAKVAVYTYNHPAYMEGVYAAMKAALVPVNVNYRYREEDIYDVRASLAARAAFRAAGGNAAPPLEPA